MKYETVNIKLSITYDLSPNSTMPTSPRHMRQTRDVPFSPNSISPISPELPRWGSFGEVAVMEFVLKGTSQVCRRPVADVTGKLA